LQMSLDLAGVSSASHPSLESAKIRQLNADLKLVALLRPSQLLLFDQLDGGIHGHKEFTHPSRLCVHITHLWVHVNTDGNSGSCKRLTSVMLSGEEPEPPEFNGTISHAVKTIDFMLVVFPRASDTHRDDQCAVSRLRNTCLTLSTRQNILT